ncbi:S8 family peptidase [Actinomyces sp. zg296]|uniref:S8 family peptidase n=1 Tax=Actinomyces sp. zg296 TaxID=2609289 RepID=UPI00135A9D33|nr:S8 family peptidase [Actinomyces sp. zg296]
MSPAADNLDHLLVRDRVEPKSWVARGGGESARRAVDRAVHGQRILDEVAGVFASTDESRKVDDVEEVLRATGTYLTLEGEAAEFPLQLDRLTSLTAHRKTLKKPKWILLSVHEATEVSPERAVIWVADEFRSHFLKLFEEYLDPEKDRWSKDGERSAPKNSGLVANISRVQGAFLRDLWTSQGEPPEEGKVWWELWLDMRRERPGLLERVLMAYNLETLDRHVRVKDSLVVHVNSTWRDLGPLTATDLPLTEVRVPSFIDTIEDLDVDERMEYVVDLAGRVSAASEDAPAVCHLDTGVFREHRLLRSSLASRDQHTAVGGPGNDADGHGTSMAGLALYGDHLDDLLQGLGGVALQHRLESVRILPERRSGVAGEPPRTYADTTIEAVSLPEISSQRRRAFCMPISATSESKPGQPTLWSTAIDALAVGTDIVVRGNEVGLISAPDPEAARLIIVSAANVDRYDQDHLANSDLQPIEDPGQSWNALTVGAYTELDSLPSDPTYRGYRPLAPAGELSPHSRTSLLFGDRSWPIKPEICLEGGNVLSDGRGMFEPRHSLLSLRSTGHRNDVALTSANATSAATAQAARLAALAMARYPSYWPETIRGLLVHEAQWTPAMRRSLDICGKKSERARLLRRYGWGVPTEEAVLSSSQSAVTMVVQDRIMPFADDFKMHQMRLHSLPWPREVLESLGDTDVRLRLTLSYFIEPSGTRRGWNGKYTYSSHGLRFDLQESTESVDEFIARVNRGARDEEEGGQGCSNDSRRWFLGKRARGVGSLHQDEWVGAGAELAACGHVVVYPTGGWWKNNRRQDRLDVPVRYCLILSLASGEQGVDLYTPIAVELGVRVSTTVGVG